MPAKRGYTSGLTADDGPPWVIELPGDAMVCRILGYSAASR